MSYPTTRTLSVEADQDRVACDAETPEAVGVPGVVGACVSAGGGFVGQGGGRALIGAVKLDVLPAASRARTSYWERPLSGSVNVVVVVVPTEVNALPFVAR